MRAVGVQISSILNSLLSPGENIIELSIVRANLAADRVDGTRSTFVMCDFYEFESEMTQLVPGLQPEYNHAVVYRVRSDLISEFHRLPCLPIVSSLNGYRSLFRFKSMSSSCAIWPPTASCSS